MKVQHDQGDDVSPISKVLRWEDSGGAEVVEAIHYDELLAENQRLENEVRKAREGWDGWQQQALQAEAENQRLRKALERIAQEDPKLWHHVERLQQIAREALAGGGE